MSALWFSLSEMGSDTKPALTGQETKIMQLLVEGFVTKEIAGKLEISEHTVKFHVMNVMTKFRVTTRLHAAILFDREQRAQPTAVDGGHW
jgi:DNA-binding NarL/FixJ family response regulator